MDHELSRAFYRFESHNLQTLLTGRRFSRARHLAHPYEFRQYGSLGEWKQRREEIKAQILVSAGLWPSLEKCALNARIFDRVVFEGFTVEKVFFESYPGFYVTGNLFRPSDGRGPSPVILNAHGHWVNGRLESTDICNVPLRCANFARLGFIAFSYDMIGYQDNTQLRETKYFLHHSGELAEAGANVLQKHGNAPEELWGISLFGLQLWNSIRCIDFVETLPDADRERIGCTGASGGGTQTFFLAAVEERIRVAVPVNMVSLSMQGGCSCENAPNLRIGTHNVEIASTIAPRPMLLASCTGDWTSRTPILEYPAIRSIYDLYGAGENICSFHDDAEHNYNRNTREAAYGWFRKHLLDRDEPWVEQQVTFGDLSALRVFQGGERPAGIEREEDLIQLLKHDRQEALRQLHGDTTGKGRRLLRTALRHAMGVSEPPDKTRTIGNEVTDIGDLIVEQAFVTTDEKGEHIPIAVVRRSTAVAPAKATVVVHPRGKNGLFADEKWQPMVGSLLSKQYAIFAPDVFLTSEFYDHCRLGRKDLAAEIVFYSAYNHTDSALRIQDIVTAYRYARSQQIHEVSLVGLEDTGSWCLAALPFLEGLTSAAIDMSGMEPEEDDWYMKGFFIPCFRSAGGFETSVRLASLERLVLFNTAGHPYAAAIERICEERAAYLNVILYQSLPDEWSAAL